MRNPPVHWHEGLFLRPQHFQAADRYWTELIQTSEAWDHAYNYGLHALEFSREALANYQFQVHALRARMRDGTIISLDPGQEPDRINLKDSVLGLKDAMADLAQAFESESIVRVYVAVPKLKIGRPNVSADGRTSEARYVESALTLQDESLGGGDQDIQLRNLNVRLLLSTQDLSGYEVLPIAQIKRAGEGEAVPQLDESYIPPVLGTDAWPGLGRDFVRAVYDLIGQKIDVLSQQVVNRGIGLDSRHPGDLDRILMLSELNAAYSGLAVLAFARGVHPLTAYLELCRIVGQLSIFSDQRRPTDIPAYDHDELARIFRWIRDRIDMLIHSVRDYEFEQRYFIGVG
ncbi:MAG: type VI secretion system baseplate subunit TssK, partial [Planctomycetaceae bacterium]